MYLIAVAGTGTYHNKEQVVNSSLTLANKLMIVPKGGKAIHFHEITFKQIEIVVPNPFTSNCTQPTCMAADSI